MKFRFLFAGVVVAGTLVFGIYSKFYTNADATRIGSEKETDRKEQRLEEVEKKIETIENQSQSLALRQEEEKLILEQAELEQELHPDEYYKEQVESDIATLKAAVGDMKLMLDGEGISEEKRAELKERVEKYGVLLEDYQKQYQSKGYDTLEKFYTEQRQKSDDLAEYFSKKYSN